MEEVIQPFISVDIKPESVAKLCEQLSATFATLGISAERSASELHVSLAYVMGSCDKAILTQIAKKIAEHKLEARVNGIEVLEGKTTGYDYVALSFESNNEFALVSEEISQEISTRKFENGFRSHLTLFRLRKGEAKNLEHVCKCLALNEKPVVCARSVSVFDSTYQKHLTIAV